MTWFTVWILHCAVGLSISFSSLSNYASWRQMQRRQRNVRTFMRTQRCAGTKINAECICDVLHICYHWPWFVEYNRSWNCRYFSFSWWCNKSHVWRYLTPQRYKQPTVYSCMEKTNKNKNKKSSRRRGALRGSSSPLRRFWAGEG